MLFRSRAARRALTVMDTLSDLVSDRCGTHLHIACRHKDLLLPLQGDVFSPLLTHMLQHPEETARFWGRYFTKYATPINANRYHCFSLDSTHRTLEFRLPRFRSAVQYVRVIKFARATVVYLDGVLETVFQRRLQQKELGGISSPGEVGRHVLGLYRAHVARGENEHSWFARLSPAEQQHALLFPEPPNQHESTVFDNEDDGDDEDEDEDDEDEGDGNDLTNEDYDPFLDADDLP